MTIRITQLDGSLPNLALMKLSHWHKQQGDTVIFEPSIYRHFNEPVYDRVYGSVIFSTTAKKVALFRQQFPDAIIGGTGSGSNETIEGLIGCAVYENYDYSLYPQFTASIGFTQRGCRLRCKFCVVPTKEGKVNQVNTIAQLWRGEPYPRHLHLLDNDFFGQPEWRERSEEIIDGKFKVSFNQGINVRLIHPEGAAYLNRMQYTDDQFKKKRIYTAWDNRKDEAIFLKGIHTLLDAGIRPAHIMVYFLCNYWPGETFDDVYYRFQVMLDLGLMPYPMLYNRDEATPQLRDFQRWVIRRYYQIVPFAEYVKQPKAEKHKGTIDLFA